MADLYELLTPHLCLEQPDLDRQTPLAKDEWTTHYLNRLSTLTLVDLNASEPSSLLHATQTHQRSLQALSKRSHKAVIAASTHFQPLGTLLPSLEEKTNELRCVLPDLESAAADFAQKYDRNTDNHVLSRRKRALLLSRTTDRIYDVLDLPNLLSSSVAVAQKSGSGASSTSTNVATSFAFALDIHSQIKRLHGLYPQSTIIDELVQQAEVEITNLTSVLIANLQSPSLKLATAMRTIGLLRRVAPELTKTQSSQRKSTAASNNELRSEDQKSNDGALAAMFLVCRLRTLRDTLDALEPLRELADQENSNPRLPTRNAAPLGSLSERYLKRYIEIFREQSFNMVSMYKSIFPDNLPQTERDPEDHDRGHERQTVQSVPSPLASFSLHLVDMLTDVLHMYLPNVIETQTRESILTQILYCAASLGRLGADFSLMIANLFDQSTADVANEAEWIQVMNKHRIQTARLEVLARGVGNTPRNISGPVTSPEHKIQPVL